MTEKENHYFEQSNLEELISLLKQEKQEKPYIDEKARTILVEIGNHFISDLLKKGISISKNKSQKPSDKDSSQDEGAEQKKYPPVEVNDFRIIAETKYNTKIDGANQHIERQIAQNELDQVKREQEKSQQLHK
ncbi:hypothetical protein ABPG72_021267 [Tetrahymena utriculariae]